MKRKINRNSIGMFDFIKGFLMILIVCVHVWWNVVKFYPGSSDPIFIRIISKSSACGMAIFFAIAGYRFRKEKMWKYLKQAPQQLLLPYLYGGIATVLLTIPWYFIDKNVTLGKRISSLIGGMLFGISQRGEYCGVWLENIHVFWYILALFNTSIMLQLILKLNNERKIQIVITGCVLAGMLLGLTDIRYPFCIPQSLCFLGPLYIGYYWKKNKTLFGDYHWYEYFICLMIFIIGFKVGHPDFGNNYWKLWLLEMVIIIAGVFLSIEACFFLFDNQRMWQQPFLFIGRYSLWIMVVHAVDCLVSNWHLVFGSWFHNLYVEYAFMLIWRSGVIVVGIWLIRLWHKFCGKELL